MKALARKFLAALPALVLAQAAGADAGAWVQDNCTGCHALEKPDYDTLGIEARAERGGPPLYYAGNKFRREWLVQWLQDPVRIRPAGDYPPAHTETTEGEDRIDESSLPEHPALDSDRAAQVADHLMGLRPHDERLEEVTYEPGDISWRMGQMNFAKFNNCIGCHQDEPGYGGVSGPELYTAWDRLQPAFIASYTADPVAWDPHTLMPGGDLNDAAVAKLANYLKAIVEEE